MPRQEVFDHPLAARRETFEDRARSVSFPSTAAIIAVTAGYIGRLDAVGIVPPSRAALHGVTSDGLGVNWQ